MVIAIEFAGMRWPAGERFIANEEIEPAVSIEIEPRAGLGGMEGEQAGRLGDVFKSAVAIIFEERIGKEALLTHPGAPEDEQIGEPVVVVIGGDGIEPAGEAHQAGLPSALGKGTVPVVVEIMHLVAQPDGGNDYVQ